MQMKEYQQKNLPTYKLKKSWRNFDDGSDDPSIEEEDKPATCLEVLPNGLVVTGGLDGIKIWEIGKSGFVDCKATIRTFKGAAKINALQVLSNERIISGDDNGEVRIWGIGAGITGALWDEKIECLAILRHKAKAVYSLQILPNNQLASGTYYGCTFGKSGVIEIWDLNSKKLVTTIKAHDFAVGYLAWLSPYLISARSVKGVGEWRSFEHNYVKVWDVKREKSVTSIDVVERGKRTRTSAMKILPNNKLALATVIEGNEGVAGWVYDQHYHKIFILDVFQGNIVRVLRDGLQEIFSGPLMNGVPNTHINSLDVMSNSLLVSGSTQGKLKIWNLDQEKSLHQTLEFGNASITSLTALPNGYLIVGTSQCEMGYLTVVQGETPEEKSQLVVDNFQTMLENPENFSIFKLEEMFNQVSDLYTFRFPYTLANIFRQAKPELKEKIDDLVISALRRGAEEFITHPKLYAIFTKVILKSAERKKIINPILSAEIAKIADNAETFADERFQKLLHDVGRLHRRVDTMEKNIQQLAESLNALKTALKRRAQRQLVFSVAKLGISSVAIFSFIPVLGGISPIFDHMADAAERIFENIADFSDILELGTAFFDIQADNISQLSQGLALLSAKKFIPEIIGGILQKAGLNPEDFLETWYQTSLELKQEMEQPQSFSPSLPPQNTPSNTQTSLSPNLRRAGSYSFISSISSTEVKPSHHYISPDKSTSPSFQTNRQHSAFTSSTTTSSNIVAKPSPSLREALIFLAPPRDQSSPKVTHSTRESQAFLNWIKKIQEQGVFALGNKTVSIQWIGEDKTIDEREELLFALHEQLQSLPEFQRISVEDVDCENDQLIIKVKNSLDTKILKRLLESYGFKEQFSVNMQQEPSSSSLSFHRSGT